MTQERGELDRLVALDAVSGAVEDDDPGVGLAPLQLGDVLVVDHRRERAPASVSGTSMRAIASHSVSMPGNDLAVFAFAAPAPGKVVAPAPAAVGVLDRVVQDAAPQRGLGSRRVELDRCAARISSNDSKYSGPSMNCAIAVAFSRFTPGVTSTSTSVAHDVGRAIGERDRR